MKFFIFVLTILASTPAISASWNFKSNVDLSPPYKKCIEAIANGKDMGKSSLKNKNQYTNYIYEIIINSSFITCLRIDLSKDQKPYPLNSDKLNTKLQFVFFIKI